MSQSATTHGALLFVGNISSQTDKHVIQRLFSAYGSVKDVDIDGEQLFATVLYVHPDDADSAIAALHLRYCMAPKLPLLVMYHARSPRISSYGRQVSAEYRNAHAEGRLPVPVPLVSYDTRFERGPVAPPVEEIQLTANTTAAAWGPNVGGVWPSGGGIGLFGSGQGAGNTMRTFP